MQLFAEDIRINVGQVVRGKPLRLMKAFPVQGETTLSARDLNASLASPLLAEGLSSFWQSLIQRPEVAKSVDARYGPLPLSSNVTLNRPQIQIGKGSLGLSFYPTTPVESAEQPVILATNLSVIEGHILQLNSARWLDQLDDLTQRTVGVPIEALEGFQWDLGQDTKLTQLDLHPSHLLCSGEIMVNP